MFNYYQPFLRPFLRLQRYTLPQDVKRYYYFSFEDGLWDLLRNKGVPPDATLLLPDFYCIDVVGNIEQHGYRVRMYHLDDHFQADAEEVLPLCRKENASALLLFHACGISCNLLSDQSFLEQLPPDLLLIEDGVHRLVDPAVVELINDRHFLIDSLRKDSPLPGSFLYGNTAALDFEQTRRQFSLYALGATFWYAVFRLLLQLGFLLKLPNLVKYAHERTLQTHDDIIGDSEKSHRGWPWVPWIHRHFDFARLEQVKATQVRHYQQVLEPLFSQNPDWYEVNFSPPDHGRLHVYPLGYKGRRGKEVLQALHKTGHIVWFKFPDAPWSQTRQVLYLPLGFHIEGKEVEQVARVLMESG